MILGEVGKLMAAQAGATISHKSKIASNEFTCLDIYFLQIPKIRVYCAYLACL